MQNETREGEITHTHTIFHTESLFVAGSLCLSQKTGVEGERGDTHVYENSPLTKSSSSLFVVQRLASVHKNPAQAPRRKRARVSPVPTANAWPTVPPPSAKSQSKLAGAESLHMLHRIVPSVRVGRAVDVARREDARRVLFDSEAVWADLVLEPLALRLLVLGDFRRVPLLIVEALRVSSSCAFLARTLRSRSDRRRSCTARRRAAPSPHARRRPEGLLTRDGR